MRGSNQPAAIEFTFFRSTVGQWLGFFGFVVAYVLLGEIARWNRLNVAQEGFVAFWPPSGLLLGALTRLDWKYSWKVAVAALLGNLISNVFLHQIAPGLSLTFWLIDCVGACAGAWVLKRCESCDFDLERVREVWLLFFGGAMLVPTIVASAGALVLSRPPEALFAPTLGRLWLGTSLGILIVTPLVLAWSAPGQRIWASREKSSLARIMERGSVTVAMLGVSYLVFSLPGGLAVDSPFFPFWQFLPILWAGLRFRPRFACLVATGAMMVALWRTEAGFGPFTSLGQSPSNQILLLQGYLGVIALTVLTLSAAVCERRRAELTASVSQARLQDFLDNANDLIQWVTPDGKFVFVNRAWRKALGYSESDLPSLNVSDILQSEADKETSGQAWNPLRDGSHDGYGEAVLVTKDGRCITVEGSVSLLREKGEITCYRGIFRDVTSRKVAEAERERLIGDLHRALQEVKTLRGYIPICSCCKKVRSEAGAWKELEEYIREHTDAEFTHGICSDCGRKQFGEYWVEAEAARIKEAEQPARSEGNANSKS